MAFGITEAIPNIVDGEFVHSKIVVFVGSSQA